MRFRVGTRKSPPEHMQLLLRASGAVFECLAPGLQQPPEFLRVCWLEEVVVTTSFPGALAV